MGVTGDFEAAKCECQPAGVTAAAAAVAVELASGLAEGFIVRRLAGQTDLTQLGSSSFQFGPSKS